MIPKIIHQTWKTSTIPDHFRAFQQTWKTHHTTWDYRLWTDIENRALIAADYAWFLPIYDNYPEPIMRVDAARYFILHRYGGVYADLDFECLQPLDTLLKEHSFVIGQEPESHLHLDMPQARQLDTILCNALIASVAEHPFWDHLFLQLVGAHRQPHTLDATGPFLITKAWQSYQRKETMRVESAEKFYPFSESDLWKNTPRPALPPTAYAIHHWQGTWWRKERGRVETLRLKSADFAHKKTEKLRQRIQQEVHDKREFLQERLHPQRKKLQELLARGHQPITLHTEQLEETQKPVALLAQGETLFRAALNTKKLLDLTGDLPRISAMMVTRNRPKLAQRAIHCFQQQTHSDKELVIIDDDPDETLFQWVTALNNPQIVHIRLPDTGQSLGELRNLAAHHATGKYVCQWDDDDLSHPHRLSIQVALLKLYPASACLLQREQLWNPDFKQFAHSKYRLWEGSFVCEKATLPPYPTIRKAEDTPVIQQIALEQQIVLLDYPELYTYVFHGSNTFEQAHFEDHWQKATARYEHGAYDLQVRRLEQALSLDLALTPRSQYQEQQQEKQLFPPQIRRKSYPHILILTPVKNARAHLPRYFHNLETLTYPHDHISLAFLESDSNDGTYTWLQEQQKTSPSFHQFHLFKHDYNYQSKLPRWAITQQRQRRCTLAKSRNYLLSRALTDEAWVLWLDVDLLSYPPNVIEQLLAVEKEIVVPHCVFENGQTFDLNSWKYKPGAAHWDWSDYVTDGVVLPPKGFGRNYLNELQQHDCIEIDAVGGTMLLVNADLHREGLNFPTFPYHYHLETENLSFLAKDMGYQSWGMPNLTIVHPRT